MILIVKATKVEHSPFYFKSNSAYGTKVYYICGTCQMKTAEYES